ncbi:hypothetical protein NDK43_05155 [Neobacillus pocheonensis]|uniref:Uncharacterized protein n=1 Tax=Neobacillus pocheonensis TaxID=363869 RepID=A0ABT0W769_9BACI|nr:hypothetical protein [Neobacillus pocheonensis]
MYRFSVEGEEWILRFSPQVFIDSDEKQAILMSLLHIGNDLSAFSHGEKPFSCLQRKLEPLFLM